MKKYLVLLLTFFLIVCYGCKTLLGNGSYHSGMEDFERVLEQIDWNSTEEDFSNQELFQKVQADDPHEVWNYIPNAPQSILNTEMHVEYILENKLASVQITFPQEKGYDFYLKLAEELQKYGPVQSIAKIREYNEGEIPSGTVYLNLQSLESIQSQIPEKGLRIADVLVSFVPDEDSRIELLLNLKKGETVGTVAVVPNS